MMRHSDAAEPSRTCDFSNNQRRAQAAVLRIPVSLQVGFIVEAQTSSCVAVSLDLPTLRDSPPSG